MNLVIWTVPPLFFLISTYVINRNKTRAMTRDFWITWGLDAVMAYSLTSILMYRLVHRSMWLLILPIVLFLISGLVRFWHGNVQSQDLDLEIETLKNNVVLFGTTFLPFLLFVYWFDAQASWLRYGGAALLALAVFGLSIPIKLGVAKLADYFYKQSQLISDLTLTIVFYVISSTALIGLLVVTVVTMYTSTNYSLSFGESFLPTTLTDDESIDWENATIVDLDVSRSNRMILLLKEDNGAEYLIRYVFSTEEDDYAEVLYLPHSSTSELTNDPYTARFGTSYIDFMTPTEGLYIFTSDDISKVPESDGVRVSFINVGFCQGCFLANNGDGTYDLWNSVFQVIETIPEAPAGTEYIIINRYLFVDDGSTYTMYDDETISFDIQAGDPTYDPEENILYTLDDSQAGRLVMTLQTPGEDVSSHTFNVDDDHLHLPLFDTFLYDPVELFARDNSTEFANGVVIHSHQAEDGSVFSVLSYDPQRYVSVVNLIRSRAAILEQTYNRDTLVLRQASLSLLITVNDNIAIRTVRLMSILSGLMLFIPITNYAKHTVVIDYDTAMKENKE